MRTGGGAVGNRRSVGAPPNSQFHFLSKSLSRFWLRQMAQVQLAFAAGAVVGLTAVAAAVAAHGLAMAACLCAFARIASVLFSPDA